MFSLNVPSNKKGSCGTTQMLLLKDSKGILSISHPSKIIDPFIGSTILSNAFVEKMKNHPLIKRTDWDTFQSKLERKLTDFRSMADIGQEQQQQPNRPFDFGGFGGFRNLPIDDEEYDEGSEGN